MVEGDEESYWLNVKLKPELHRSEFTLEIIKLYGEHKHECLYRLKHGILVNRKKYLIS